MKICENMRITLRIPGKYVNNVRDDEMRKYNIRHGENKLIMLFVFSVDFR